jgi:rod shape determining protein RodA
MLYLLIPSFFLSLFGIFNVFGIKHAIMWSQVLYFVIAYGAYFFVRKIGRHFFQINSQVIYWVFVFVLLITFFIGMEVKGSQRWIDFYFYKFQASEFFKIIFILYLSDLLTKKHVRFALLRIFFKSIFYFIIPTFIIFKQPDLGNALVLAIIFLSMLLFSDIPKKYILFLGVVSMLFLPIGWFFLKDYQQYRILSFINPHLDTQGTSYNMIQAVITVGSGMFLGRGLGLGTQSRLFFLPENLTDFAFSSLVEQFGFIGGLIIIILYGVIFWYLITKLITAFYEHSHESKRNFLYVVGLLSYLAFQFFVNIGMNMGMVPIAGIALPFISYGGSSVLALLIGFALIP